MSKEVEITVLKKSGEIKFCRGNKEYNKGVQIIISPFLSPHEKKEVEKFLKGSEDIEVILGDEILCG